MANTALVVGGTGPTGPHVVRGLRARGYDVTVMHRGVHEVPELTDVRHLHADPHFPETIMEAVGRAEFDVVVGMYGRLRYLTECLGRRTAQFVAVTGVPAYTGYYRPAMAVPYGLAIPLRENAPTGPPHHSWPREMRDLRFQQLVADAERSVLKNCNSPTLLRYPLIYGPRNQAAKEWSVVKRVLDGRRQMIMPDAGLQIHSRCAALNAAQFVLLSVGNPVAAGKAYNCADDVQFSIRQWAEVVVGAMASLEMLAVPLEFVAIPASVAIEANASLMPMPGEFAPHCLLSTERARNELGYRDVQSPQDGIADTVRYLVDQREDELTSAVGWTDRFDYAMEDRLIQAYSRASAEVLALVPQELAAPVHGMPHPKEPSMMKNNVNPLVPRRHRL